MHHLPKINTSKRKLNERIISDHNGSIRTIPSIIIEIKKYLRP